MLRGIAKSIGVVAIALVGFFAAKALTDRFDSEATTPEPNRPKIYGIAGAPAPEPPDWPVQREPDETAEANADEDSGDEAVAVETTIAPDTTPTPEEAETPGPDTNTPPPDSGGNKESNGSSGSGVEEEVGG